MHLISVVSQRSRPIRWRYFSIISAWRWWVVNFVALCVWVTSIVGTVCSLDLIGYRTWSQIVRTACCLLVLSFQLLGFVRASNQLLWLRRRKRKLSLYLREDAVSEIITASRYVDVSITIFCLLYCNFRTRFVSRRLRMPSEDYQMCRAKIATNSKGHSKRCNNVVSILKCRRFRNFLPYRYLYHTLPWYINL